MTSGQRSPKVLMISAVCGRAPPREAPPKPSEVPPPPPLISQDLLSVIKTRGRFPVPVELSCAHTVTAHAPANSRQSSVRIGSPVKLPPCVGLSRCEGGKIRNAGHWVRVVQLMQPEDRFGVSPTAFRKMIG